VTPVRLKSCREQAKLDRDRLAELPESIERKGRGGVFVGPSDLGVDRVI
jgi:hypothetical protein